MKTKTLIVLFFLINSLNILYGQTSGNYILENDSLKATISIPSMQINAYYKVNGQSYTTQALGGYSVTSINASTPQKLVVNTTTLNITFSISGNAINMVLGGDANKSISDFQFPGHIISNSNDYMIVPRSSGMIWPVTQDYPFWGSYLFNTWKSSMSFVGVTNLKSGYMLVSDDPWDTGVWLNKWSGETTVNPKLNHFASKGKLGYTRTAHLVFVNNGYVEMMQWYRKNTNRLGWSKTFSQKAAVNPNINKLKGAVDFWTYSTGSTASDYTKLADYGLDKAIFTLHESQFGMINALNQKGFLTSVYESYIDVFPPGSGWWYSDGYPQDVMVKNDGSMQAGWVAYVDGNPVQGYKLCPSTHSKYVRSRTSAKLSSNPLNSQFVDVSFASALSECYSADHPMSRKTDGQSRVDVFNILKNEYSLVTGGEEGFDFGYSAYDYGHGEMGMLATSESGYDWTTPNDNPGNDYIAYSMNPTVRLPLLGLAYHDSHMPTWYTGDGVSKVPAYWDDKDLFNILYASMSLFFPPSKTYFDANFERFMASYHLTSSLTRNVGFDQMTNHTFITSDRYVQQTEFSSGWKVTANFNASSYQYGTKLLAAKGFYATDGGQNEVFKLVDSGSNLAGAFTGDRLYINPYGVEKTYKGVKTSGSVFFRKDASSVHLAFIGSQTSIKINSSQMPWVVKKAFSEATGKEITLTNLGSGWYQINRPSGEDFIRLEVDIAMSQEEDVQVRQIECYPNPVRGDLHIDMDLPTSQNVGISLFDLTGKAVKDLMNDKALPGTNNLVFNLDGVTPGTYVLRIKTDEKTISKKIVVL